MDILTKLITELPAVGAICLVVYLFLKAQKNLITIITNHLQHNSEALTGFTKVVDELKTAINELSIWVRAKNNGQRKK